MALSEWVKTEDRLPAPWTTVLAWSADGKNQVKDLMQQCTFTGHDFSYGFHNNRVVDVTHWMLMPDAPETDTQ